jgi:tungstate transport system ATP-binding protein
LRGRRDDVAIETALAAVGLSALASARARTLSGGEMQRVALARALVIEPRVLLLDEPTANLDPANVAIIEAAVRTLHTRQGTTIVLATHNLYQARRLAGRVALLLDGRLIEIGSTDQILNAPRDPRTRAFVSGEMVY